MYERTTCPATIGQGVRMILMIVAEPSSTHVELTSTALLCIMLGTPERWSGQPGRWLGLEVLLCPLNTLGCLQANRLKLILDLMPPGALRGCSYPWICSSNTWVAAVAVAEDKVSSFSTSRVLLVKGRRGCMEFIIGDAEETGRRSIAMIPMWKSCNITKGA